MAASQGQFWDENDSIAVDLPGSPSVDELQTSYNVISIENFPSAPAVTSPYPVGVNLHQTGGGLLNLQVRGTTFQPTYGAAEKWAHAKLTSLGATGRGVLFINDLGWEQVFFVSGEATFEQCSSMTIIHYDLNFITSVKLDKNLDFTPTYGSDPGFSSGGTNSNMDYTFVSSTNTLEAPLTGSHTNLVRIAVSRPVDVVSIPRCNGVRIHPQRGGRKVLLSASAHFQLTQLIDPVTSLPFANPFTTADREHFAQSFAMRMGSAPGILSGQGNVFNDCFLTVCKPVFKEGIMHSLKFDLTFEQLLDPTST
jgi:hypothetical protein